MSNTPIIKIQKVDVKNLELQFPKGESSNKNGFYVHVRHNKTKIRAMLPDVIAPYGAGPQKDYGGELKYSMGICFDGMETDDANGRKIKSAYGSLEAIQERLKGLMFENKEAFFADAGKPKKKGEKPVSDDVLESRYQNFLRPREDRTDIMYVSLQRQRIKKEEEDKLTLEEKEARYQTIFVLAKLSSPYRPRRTCSRGHHRQYKRSHPLGIGCTSHHRISVPLGLYLGDENGSTGLDFYPRCANFHWTRKDL